MESVLNVAAYIFDKYKEIANITIDEMKLHKLLYFAQRQSLVIYDKPLFTEQFEGWQYGPVCVTVRQNFTDNGIKSGDVFVISWENKRLLDDIVMTYGAFESWKLSEISHRETSWQKSREGLLADEPGHRPLRVDDIMQDGIRSLEVSSKEIDPSMYLSKIETIRTLPASWNNPEDDIYDRL